MSIQRTADYPAPSDDPLSYPGRRPASSFIVADNRLYPTRFAHDSRPDGETVAAAMMVSDAHGKLASINDFMVDRGASPIHQRYAVIGYGSNPVPGQLVHTLGQDAVVPVVLGSMEGADLVYNLASNMGYAFAELHLRDSHTVAPVAVTFLDENQLKLMVGKEQNYHLAYSPADIVLESGDTLAGGVKSALYVFAGRRRLWAPDRYRMPIGIAELPVKDRALPELTQKQALSLAIYEFDLPSMGVSSPIQFAERMRREFRLPERAPKLKFHLQEMIENDPNSLPALAEQVALVDSIELLRYADF